jgi:LuxR family quorum-sensing system transcriptional regulator CciR
MSSTLTARQKECLRLTRLMTDREIAAHLGLSEPTVKKHVAEACQRLGVNRRKAALALLEQSDGPGVALSTPADPAPAPERRRGYRAPPRGSLARIALMGVMALILLLAIQVATFLMSRVFGHVDQIDKAVSPMDRIGPIPPVRP